MLTIKIKNFFTLIELIVVIVVIGILAAIVIPNISSFQEEAKETALLSDSRNIQTAVDMFMLDYHGATPTKEKAEFGNPQVIELYGMQPDYLRDIPKQGRFWLDDSNTVWVSTADAPTGVGYEAGELTWNTAEDASSYNIYKKETATASKATGKGMELVKELATKSGTIQSFNGEDVSTAGTYLVSAVDKYGYETPAIVVNSDYTGYGEGPKKSFTFNGEASVPTPTNPAFEKLKLGDFVAFGKHLNGTPIKWNVVKKENGKVMLFMTEPIKDTGGNYLKRSYDVAPNTGEFTDANRVTYGSSNWGYSDLRTWLNGYFYNRAFQTDAEKGMIKDSTHDYILADVDIVSTSTGTEKHIVNPIFNQAVSNYSVAYKNTITDKVFLVNLQELSDIEEVIGNNYYNNSYLYLTRDANPNSSFAVRYVENTGVIGNITAKNTAGVVRTALLIEPSNLSTGVGSNESPYIIE